ncbi:glycosyltransferase family A protein [Alteromonas sp. C1M14]|uniref:glycosyltransferase family 2 protein n=1 Tax=Alteromonas sp. C1M14 TaxID=2841567 RepID=UPI001C07FF9D|nr:glycosyltransferase family A protein [Alteromonas sp. C1M14]MBU2979945.1 glycosyltransferase family 2 protein [Alteromonas sp. C1M14]
MMEKIAVVTPLKDEIDNIDRLINSISTQSTRIYCWIIVENGSKDGSKELLERIKTIDNVDNFIVLNFALPNEEYQLGVKYSTVVNTGFEHLMKLIKEGDIDKPDFLGICDADCFPSSDYYKTLTEYMKDNSISISSGIGIFEDGSKDGEASEWVRGNCRLWTYDCFMDCGYYVGPSADTLSLGKAELKGYKTYPCHELTYTCREMGSRTRYSYYGYSSYYRGITPLYAVLKFFNFIAIGQRKQSIEYLKGYFSSMFGRKERLPDLELRKHFSNTLSRKIKKAFSK